MTSFDLSSQGLGALEKRLSQELSLLNLPPKSWMPVKEHGGNPVHPIVIIGGGMAGLCAAAALRLNGIPSLIVDQSSKGLEGPWATTARMETLRSPKELTGPALGIPSLTFRAWFTAQFGEDAWVRLDKIPRLQWAEYLQWFGKVTEAQIWNRVRAESVTPTPEGIVTVQLRNLGDNTSERIFARRVILATGRDGLGGPWVPEWSNSLPRDRWLHSSDYWDDAIFHGKRVVVIGIGSSAMDSAATALENGAARVHVLGRRAQIPRVNKSKGAVNPGMTHGFWQLPDEWKWRVRRYLNVQQVPPPQGSTLRVSRHPNAYFHTATQVEAVAINDDGSIRLITNQGPLDTDLVVFSTGFNIDLTRRPEFAGFAHAIRTWGERYQPCAEDHDLELSSSPDLGPAFEFRARSGASCPGLERIHCFCYPATLSHGPVAGDIPQISDGAQRMAQAICALFLEEDMDLHFQQLQAYQDPELNGDEWVETPLADLLTPDQG
jgi:Predicted flavoprotein involved in K+ transport